MKISKQRLKQIIKEEISNFQNYLSEENELEIDDTYYDVVGTWNDFTADEGIDWEENVMESIADKIQELYFDKEITTVTQMVQAYAKLLEAAKGKLYINNIQNVINNWVKFVNSNLPRLQNKIEI